MIETMPPQQLKQVRVWLLLFMSGLIISGLTALPIKWEIDLINSLSLNLLWK